MAPRWPCSAATAASGHASGRSIGTSSSTASGDPPSRVHCTLCSTAPYPHSPNALVDECPCRQVVQPVMARRETAARSHLLHQR